MLYKFRTRAAAPVMLMGRSAECLLGILGKPLRAHGIIAHDELPHALEALFTAIEDDEAGRGEPPGQGRDAPGAADRPVTLRARALPLIEMIERAHADGADVTWAASRPAPAHREPAGHAMHR